MEISVVVVTRNRPEALRRCLLSISRQTMQPRQLIVVDSSLNTISIDGVGAGTVPVTIIPVSSPLRCTSNVARNRGLGEVKHEVVAVVDDDVELRPQYLARSVAALGPGIGAVGGRAMMERKRGIVYAIARAVNTGCAMVFGLTHYCGRGRFQRSGFAAGLPWSTPARSSCQVVCGNCLVGYSHVFKEIKFNETLNKYGGPFGDDDDFALQLCEAGYTNIYEPTAVCFHYNSTIRAPRRRSVATMVVNSRYLHRRYVKQTWVNLIAWWWAMVGLCLQVIGKAVLFRNADGIAGYFDGMRDRNVLTKECR